MNYTSRNSSAKKKLVGVTAGLLAFAGLATFATSANANSNNIVRSSTAPKITLAELDRDVVVASGRNYAANSEVSITADSSSLTGTGTVKVDSEGRFLVAFKIPAGFNDRLKVSSASPAESATIRVRVGGGNGVFNNNRNDRRAPQVGSKLATLNKDLAAAQAEFNKEVGEANGKITAMNAAIRSANATQQQSVVNDVNNLNTKLSELNTKTKADDAALAELNTKAEKANGAELQALLPEAQKLTASIQARVTAAKEISTLADQITAKVKA